MPPRNMQFRNNSNAVATNNTIVLINDTTSLVIHPLSVDLGKDSKPRALPRGDGGNKR
jgi:hypothetical protein